ncbi:hypothetical protein [Flavobacterium sp.]|uniref:hypothetical protein n=1 Tax=Flavobacterium sp. TaxID=239 RepID=UPI00403372D9
MTGKPLKKAILKLTKQQSAMFIHSLGREKFENDVALSGEYTMLYKQIKEVKHINIKEVNQLREILIKKPEFFTVQEYSTFVCLMREVWYETKQKVIVSKGGRVMSDYLRPITVNLKGCIKQSLDFAKLMYCTFNSVEDIIAVTFKDGNDRNFAIENLVETTIKNMPLTEVDLKEEEYERGLKPHKLYVAILAGFGETFCKIGVTSHSVSIRFKDQNYRPIEFKEYDFKDGFEARGWESLLLERVLPHSHKYYPNHPFFGGKNECYDYKIYKNILKFIDDKRSA